VATAALESSLKVPRTARDLGRVYQELCVLRGRRLKPSLGGGFISQRYDGKQREPDNSAKRDQCAVAATCTWLGIRGGVV